MTSQKQAHTKGHHINCLPCRRRKSKCDREEPCSSCVLRQTEAYCYTNEEPPATNKISSAKSSSEGSYKRILEDESVGQKPIKMSRTDLGGRKRQSARSTAQAAIENIEYSVEAVKQYLSTASKLTDEIILTSSTSTLIEWDDLLAILPPLHELQHIIHCYFSELTWILGCVHQGRFESMWAQAQEAKVAIPRHRASLLCSIISLVDLMGPKSHPAAQIVRRPNLHAKVQRENARLLLETYYYLHDAEENEEGGELNVLVLSNEEALLQLEAETLYCAYSCAAGLFRRGWQGIGRAIRLAKSLAVFSSSRWSNSELEEEHRCLIAWELIILDRWTSMFYIRTFDLGIQVTPPDRSFRSNVPLHLRNTTTNILAKIIQFQLDCSSMDMNQRSFSAEAIKAEYDDWQSKLPREYIYEVACFNMNSNDPDSFKLAAQALNFHASRHFALCTLFQPFLMDPAAPSHLQFASLVHARKIIESMHVIATMYNSPWVSHSPAWNAQHLFTAATIFANVFLSDQESSTLKKTWPAEDLDWFASTIFEVVDTFHLVVQGTRHHTARVCQNILVALCNSREALKQRYQARERHIHRPSTPTIFLDSSRNSQADVSFLDPALKQDINSSNVSNGHFYPQDKIIADATTQASNLMLDSFALFDPWEWARLTANLST